MLSIIVPVYNEKKYIKFLLKKLIDLKELKKQIIIVDDGSYDGTTDILKNKFIRSKFVNKIIFHKLYIELIFKNHRPYLFRVHYDIHTITIFLCF